MNAASLPTGERPAPGRKSHRYFGHACSTLLSHASRVVVGVFLPPFVIARIGAAGYGLTVMVTSALTFVALLQLGIPQATIRYVSERLAHGDHEGATRVYSSAVATLGAAAVVAAVAVASIAYHPAVLGRVGVELSETQVRSVTLLLGAALVFGMPLMAGEAALMARREFPAYAGIQTATTLLRAAGVLLLLPGTAGALLVYAGISAASTLAAYGASAWWQRSLHPRLAFARPAVDGATARTLLRHGAAVVLTTIAWLFVVNAAYLVVGRYRGAEQLALYSLALVWSSLLQGVATSISQVLLADAAGSAARGERAYVATLVLRASRFLLVGTAPVIVFLLLFRRELIETWLGSGFQLTADLMVPILLGELFTVANSPSANVAVVTGVVRAALKWNVALAAGSAALLFAGVTRGGWGVHEAALLYGAVTFVRGGVIYPLLMAPYLGVPVRQLWARTYLRPSAAALSTAALVGFVDVGPGWGNMISAAALTGLVGWCAGYLIGLDGYERSVALSAGRELSGRVRAAVARRRPER